MKIIFKRIKYFIIIIIFFISSCKENRFEKAKNQKNNVDRYIRIALEKLDEYMDKSNRKNKKWDSEFVDNIITHVFNELKKNNFEKAESYLKDTFEELADEAEDQW